MWTIGQPGITTHVNCFQGYAASQMLGPININLFNRWYICDKMRATNMYPIYCYIHAECFIYATTVCFANFIDLLCHMTTGHSVIVIPPRLGPIIWTSKDQPLIFVIQDNIHLWIARSVVNKQFITTDLLYISLQYFFAEVWYCSCT
jgi:hypothetical protein